MFDLASGNWKCRTGAESLTIVEKIDAKGLEAEPLANYNFLRHSGWVKQKRILKETPCRKVNPLLDLIRSRVEKRAQTTSKDFMSAGRSLRRCLTPGMVFVFTCHFASYLISFSGIWHGYCVVFICSRQPFSKEKIALLVLNISK